MGVQITQCEWAVLRGKGWPIVKCRDCAVGGAEMAEPIEMLFGGMDSGGPCPRKHVLDRVHIGTTR